MYYIGMEKVRILRITVKNCLVKAKKCKKWSDLCLVYDEVPSAKTYLNPWRNVERQNEAFFIWPKLYYDDILKYIKLIIHI